MSVTAEGVVSEPRGGASWLWKRQLASYPDTGPRVLYLAMTVLATITLYYELYVGGSVSTLLLVNLHMSFTFFVTTLAFGNLIGAFGSLFAGLSDRLGRANLVVFGLFFTGIFVAFIIPAATTKWTFTIESFVVGVVEGICLVATPALIRDFSPQVGRATAMGFWTSGPVLGSLIVAVVGSATIPAIVKDPRFWTHEYRICGIAGLVVFVIALLVLRELSPQLRDQLMVTMHDRALIELRAKGLDIESALRHPFRQLLKADVVISAIAVSLMLLVYYTAVGFGVIYFTTVFGFSLKDANGLGNWNWGFNVLAVILVGVVSDRFRVRKPFMVIGAVVAAVMIVIYLMQAGHHPSYYTLAIMLAVLSFGLGVAYTPWMASFTETVEARNPALTATALAFASTHASLVALAQKDVVQLRNAQKFAPELAVIQAHPALFAKLATFSNPATIPLKLQAQAVAAAGGGAKGVAVLTTIATNKTAIDGVIAVGPQLQQMAPFVAQLTALNKVPKSVDAFMTAHGLQVAGAATAQYSQWKNWYWICFGGIILFLFSIPLLRGRWKPADARKDEQAHEALVDAELASLRS